MTTTVTVALRTRARDANYFARARCLSAHGVAGEQVTISP